VGLEGLGAKTNWWAVNRQSWSNSDSGPWPYRLGESRIWDSKIWWVSLDSYPKITALARTSSNCKRQTRSLITENAPPRHTRDCLTNKNLILGPRWVLAPRQTGRLAVSRNITLTFVAGCRCGLSKLGMICFAKPGRTEELYTYSAQRRISSIMLYLRYLHVTKAKHIHKRQTQSSRERGSYARTMTLLETMTKQRLVL
jgi:hypothetical protein